MLLGAVFAPKHFNAKHHERNTATGMERVVKIRYADKLTRYLYQMLKEHTESKATHAENARRSNSWISFTSARL